MVEALLAALVAWVWLGESLSAAQLVGGAVVLVGVILAQTSRWYPAARACPEQAGPTEEVWRNRPVPRARAVPF